MSTHQSKKTHIIIHHSVSPDGVTRNWPAIRRWHVEHNSWRDVGYHYGVELVGNKYQVQKGREENETGAHCLEQRMNYVGFGICCVGNYDDKEPPEEMYQVTAELCADLCKRYGIPVENIQPHRQYAINGATGKPYKSCPGWSFDMTKLRALTRSMLGDHGVNLLINGRPTEVPLRIVDGRTEALLSGAWVQLRDLANMLHAQIGWDPETRTVNFIID